MQQELLFQQYRSNTIVTLFFFRPSLSSGKMMYARHEKGNIGDIHLYINAFIHIFINIY